jgi:phage tail-like protein
LLALFACVFLLGQGRANAQETKLQFQFTLRVEALGFVETFAECSGMGSQSEIIEHTIIYPGGDITTKLPGKLKFYEITCRRAVTARSSLWTWRRLIEDGNVLAEGTNGEISLIDLKGVEIARWVFTRGWPASLKINDKDFREELVLTLAGVERVH